MLRYLYSLLGALALLGGGSHLAQAQAQEKASVVCYGESLAGITLSRIQGSGSAFSYDGYETGPGITFGAGCAWHFSPRWWVGGVLRYGIDGVQGAATNNGATAAIDHDHSWNALAQLGYHTSDAWSVYLTGGAVGSYYSARGLSAASVSDMNLGWALGFGLDRRLTSSLALRMEYLYADYSGRNYLLGTPAATRIEPTENIFRLGLKFHLWP